MAGAQPLQAKPPKPSARESMLAAFRTAKDLGANPPPETEWYAPGVLPRAAFVQLTGAAKGGGKTTFLLHALRSILTGRPFLGRATRSTGVVYLTEQSRETFENEYLGRTGLLERDDLHVLYAYKTTAYPWAEIVGAAVAKAVAEEAGILVFDTFARFARIRDEQDAAQMTTVLVPLQDAAAKHGLTVVVVHHDRKGGGDPWESGRGSSAFAGAVDAILNLRRPGGGVPDTVRELRAEGRFGDLENSLMVELTDSGYVARGSGSDVKRRTVEQWLRETLPTSEAEARHKTAIDVEAKRECGSSSASVTRALNSLEIAGRLGRTGEGVKGDPFRYYLTVQDTEAA